MAKILGGETCESAIRWWQTRGRDAGRNRSLAAAARPAMPKTKPLRAGLLEKKGSMRTNWLRRWFELEPSALHYLDKKGGSRKGSIALDATSQARASEAPKRYPHEIEVITPARTYRIKAQSQEECDAWLAALCSAIEAVSAPPASAAAADEPPAGAAAVAEGVPPRPRSNRQSLSLNRLSQSSKMIDSGALGDGSYAQILSLLNLADGFYGQSNDGSWTESWERGRDMDGERMVGRLAKALVDDDQAPFTDPSFPADDSSIWARPHAKGDFLAGRKIEWKRPAEILDTSASSVVFSGSIDADDVSQGALGNCYLLAALASCASSDSLLKDLIIEDFGAGGQGLGLYGVKFFKRARWITVVVDDLFPCTQRDDGLWVPLFSSPSAGEQNAGGEKELWCMIVEKAWAKLHGSYEVCDGGECVDTCKYLTGGEVTKIRTAHAPSVKAWFDELKGALKKKAFVSTSVRRRHSAQAAKAVGLVPGHAYSVLYAITLANGLNLVLAKNPWGSVEWNGEYCDGHKCWTPKLKREVDKLTRTTLGTKPLDDGSFWMKAEDFQAWFGHIGSCNPWQRGSSLQAVELKLAPRRSSGGPPGFSSTFRYNPAVEIKCPMATTVWLSVQQRDIRGTSQEIWPYIMLYTQEAGESPKHVLGLDHRSEGFEVKLNPRKPLKLVATGWKPGYEGEVWITVAAQHKCSVEKVEADRPSAEDAGLMAKISEDPSCYISGRPADFSKPHFVTDHGFVFKECYPEYEKRNAVQCAHCGKPCIGESIMSKNTGLEFCSMDCAKAHSAAARQQARAAGSVGSAPTPQPSPAPSAGRAFAPIGGSRSAVQRPQQGGAKEPPPGLTKMQLLQWKRKNGIK